MTSNYSNRDSNRDFNTRRSDRYRHPEQDSNYRFDDYGSSARGGYGNEGNTGTWGNQGNEMAGSRNTSNQDTYGTYSTSRNYGNMGSYGGAQGFGSSRGGQHQQGEDYNFYSGKGSADEARQSNLSSPANGINYRPSQDQDHQRSYGYQSDYDSHGSSFRNDSQPDLYGSDTSRRFEGSSQGRYDFNDNYDRGNGSYGNSSNQRMGYGTQGNYMGSGYNRNSNSDYNSGNYGSMGRYSRGGNNSDYGSSVGQSSNYSRDTGNRYPNETYPRDRYNNRIQHPDSQYDYDPNRSYSAGSSIDYMQGGNRNRTWSRNHDRGSDRY